MYTATAGLMFDTPEDAERAAELLNELFKLAQARQSSSDADKGTEGDTEHQPDELHQVKESTP